MITFVTVVHVVVCIFLILVILLQAGKGGGLAGAFGGGGAQTVFGGRGAQTLLGKMTSAMAAIFMLTSLTLAYNASKTGSVMDRRMRKAASSAPAPVAPRPPAPVGRAGSLPGQGAPPLAPPASK